MGFNNFPINKSSKTLTVLIYILIFAPIAIYLFNVHKYALNIPRQDDYGAILEFLNNFKKNGTEGKIALLFSQHNEHRILSSRIVYAAYYTIFGNINFKNIIYLDALILILFWAIIIYFVKRSIPKDWHVAAFVFSLCLFDLNNFENADFAMAGMQNYGILLLFMASILFYSFNNKKYIIPAVILQALSVFSSGNGNVAAFFIVLFVLLQKDKSKIIVSVAAFIICAPLYYYDYHQPGVSFFTSDMSKVIPYFLHVTGAHFSYDYGMIDAVVLLLILLLTLPLGKKLKIKNNTAPLLCLAVFVLASMAVMSLFRAKLAVNFAYSSRYFIYPHLLVAIIFAFVLVLLQGKKIKVPLIIAMLVILLISYNMNCRDGIRGFTSFNTSLKTLTYDFPDSATAKQIADESCRLNIYCIEHERSK